MRPLQPYRVYLIYSTIMSLLRSMYWTAAVYFYVTVVGLNPFQLVIVGTTLMIVILLCETPTGVVADVYSRRLSVIIGTALIGAGFLLDGAMGRFEATLAAQLVWGLGVTFTSGALDAWITDELKGTGVERVFIRGAQLGNLGALLGIGGAVVLANLGLNLPMMLAGGIGLALAMFLMFAMGEHNFARKPRNGRSRRRMAGQTLWSGVTLVRGSSGLLMIMGVTFFFGVASESFDRLWEVHFLRQATLPVLGNLTPVAWFGLINAGGLALSIGASEIVWRLFDTEHEQILVRLLALMTGLLMLGMIGFGLATSFGFGLAAYWSAYLMRQLYVPLYTAWINRHAESEVRATVLSFSGQVDAIGQIAGGPLFGMIATVYSTGSAMIAAALTLSPTLLLYRLAARREQLTATATVGTVVEIEGAGVLKDQGR